MCQVAETFLNGAAFCSGLRLEVGDKSDRAGRGGHDLPDTIFIADKWCDM
jgi:hypothetical protein